MEQFSAAKFYNLSRQLANTQQFFKNELARRGPQATFPVSLVERGENDEDGETLIEALETSCRGLGLKVSLKCVQRIQYHLTHETTCEEYIEATAQLELTIGWEMEDKLFMHVPSERAAFYDQPELLGKGVIAKFPFLQYDIVESGNCYAAGRSTAVVFHLMRIMETGVQKFGEKLHVPLVDEKVWQVILDQTNKAIKSLNAKDPSTVEMSQAAANLYAVKLAWRNEVMHPKDTYTLEEADNLIRQVKIFMEQLAAIV